MYPSSSLTDAQWAILEPLLPPPGNTAGRGGRPEKHCRRLILDAIFYLVRGGIAWRQLPAEYPPPMTVYAVFARWVRGGAWQRIQEPSDRGGRHKTETQCNACMSLAGSRSLAIHQSNLLVSRAPSSRT
ncbi:transposase [Rhodococcus qingshengii BKS 20-40]|nr:transposase [Rhodococcus qingshengii BKS 20-40]